MIGFSYASSINSEICLWRRIPHPDTHVSGGPEIDFMIITDDTLLLGEAKWKSGVGKAQGKNKDKDQIQLRIEYLEEIERNNIFPNVRHRVVLGVALSNDGFDTQWQSKSVKVEYHTWDEICSIESHPLFSEIQNYLKWKMKHS